MKTKASTSTGRPSLVTAYYRLTKPGIIYGNSVNVAAGFFLASGIAKSYDFGELLAILAGSALVMAAGCVCNNFIDRDIDKKMRRTQRRGFVTGSIPAPAGLAYGIFLLVAGFWVLAAYTNAVTVAVGAIGFVAYVALYGFAKRRSKYGTLVGSISGAIPPVAGYTAVTGRLDTAALILFAILVTWQMPHFYAIAMFRLQEYKAAGLPVWPAVAGMADTKKQVARWIAAFWLATCLLTAYGYTGYLYLAGSTALCAVWFWKAAQGYHTTDDTAWARGMFLFSLVVTLGMALLLAAGARLP